MQVTARDNGPPRSKRGTPSHLIFAFIFGLRRTLNYTTYCLLFNLNSVADPSIPNYELRIPNYFPNSTVLS